MGGTVVMIAILLLFPVLVAAGGAVAAAAIGAWLKVDRDRAFEGTEHLALSRSGTAES